MKLTETPVKVLHGQYPAFHLALHQCLPSESGTHWWRCVADLGYTNIEFHCHSEEESIIKVAENVLSQLGHDITEALKER